MNTLQARDNMIKQQLRACNVLNENILTLAERLPREKFVPQSYTSLAYADIQIPLAHQQYMMIPKMECLILQALAIKITDRVLEIGTGTGYLTALLASLGKSVCSVDIYPDFTLSAGEKLKHCGINNIQLATADGTQGWQRPACYDVIVVTGSLPYSPKLLCAQLANNGRLFSVIGSSPAMQATVISRRDDDFASQVLFETDLQPLHMPATETFHF